MNNDEQDKDALAKRDQVQIVYSDAKYYSNGLRVVIREKWEMGDLTPGNGARDLHQGPRIAAARNSSYFTMALSNPEVV